MKLIETGASEFETILDRIGMSKYRLWAKGKGAKSAINHCYRGDWLLRLYQSLCPHNLRRLTLTKGFCANTARHHLHNSIYVKGIDTAIAFGNGGLDIEELNSVLKTLEDKQESDYLEELKDSSRDPYDTRYSEKDREEEWYYESQDQTPKYSYRDAAIAACICAVDIESNPAYADPTVYELVKTTQDRFHVANICLNHLNFNEIEFDSIESLPNLFDPDNIIPIVS